MTHAATSLISNDRIWLNVIGIGDDGLTGIGAAARTLIDRADVLIGGERHLDMIPSTSAERLHWPSPLVLLIEEIQRRRGSNVCVLATGNPMFFGVGVTLARQFSPAEMNIIPAPSAFSLVCARLGWAQADINFVTLHGRPLELVNSYLQPGAKLLVLSHDGRTPDTLARYLVNHGFGLSRMTVFEHLGGAQENYLQNTAMDWDQGRCADLNTVAVELAADSGTPWYARNPGLPDTAFIHDGQLSKREIRAMTLAKLQPASHHLLWDVGAGCGSVSIEWLRAARNSRAIGIEPKAARVKTMAQNASALGVCYLQIIEQAAPKALADLESPDAIFIGGGLSKADMFETCWRSLKPGGRLVANAVTLESEAILLRTQQKLGGELCRLSVARAEPVGGRTGWRPLMPVTQYAVFKP